MLPTERSTVGWGVGSVGCGHDSLVALLQQLLAYVEELAVFGKAAAVEAVKPAHHRWGHRYDLRAGFLQKALESNGNREFVERQE